MCGRATLTNSELNDVVAALDAEVAAEDAVRFRPRFNIAPSDSHWILEPAGARRRMVPAVWGYLTKGRPLINVRSEQVATGRGFRDAFATRRCLMVTDGFFEWDKSRAPYWFHRTDGGLVLLAGLYQEPPTDQPTSPPRFTVLTTRPNGLVAAVHNRMPVVVSQSEIDAWLKGTPAMAVALLRPADERALIATAVSKRVNTVKNDDATCLLPPAPAERDRQGQLF